MLKNINIVYKYENINKKIINNNNNKIIEYYFNT